ncbi:TIGR03086 family metal-binding protein [Microlunatus sp. Gsoil 973]|uniref:TIGR03086 family metal-binding protein n=1 Tax=Microlunatus sp. Gsoil 973 TaxID=2672569 RepID=UPI0012B4A882|nr:TIGR03086 family metal-binding protein [Microlunatus sp. Gsoil 973]QGN33678.1 TIGR03086 family protein [Microlunatus sp. Gsoil 973]
MNTSVPALVPDRLPDLRPKLARAQQWVAGLIAGVTPEQFGDPTPCEDLDVEKLIAHLWTGARRVEVMANGGDARSIPFLSDLPDGDLADGYRAVAEASRQAWAAADLSRPVAAPWGTVPGALALGGYLQEAVTHGWDLAVATGQPAEADEDLARAALAAAQRALPAQPRGGQIPFGPVVESAPDATPTQRLVNWTGRSSREWPRTAAAA